MNINRYWKPDGMKPIGKKALKKLKAKQKQKTPDPMPKYNEEWQNHWKGL